MALTPPRMGLIKSTQNDRPVLQLGLSHWCTLRSIRRCERVGEVLMTAKPPVLSA